MNISVLITNNNSIIIDPTVSLNADAVGCYNLQFEFQQPWDSDLTLYAIFKPKLDTPIYIALNEHKSCLIPAQIYHRFAKLGIGLKGVKLNAEGIVEKQCTTNLFYVPVRKSGANFVEDLI